MIRNLLDGDSTSHPLWPLRVLDSYGNLLMRQQKSVDVGSKHTLTAALVDTGASALDVSDAEFKSIVNITVEAMQRDNQEMLTHNTKKLIWEDPDTGINMIRKEAVPYLPTLAYYVGKPPQRTEIRIQPKYFLSECDINSCHLDVSPSPDGIICLGHPLFRAYDVKFDVSNYSVYFSPHRSSSGSVGQPQQDTQSGGQLSLVGQQLNE
ncbi:hypothetical protein FOZ60_005499 [Perkinsus olseni]|uniref:Uncharacterized protein n=1 Tax=Perkinsus olseni TaxID=32597 RepID=A0A7J6PHH9_PEROL|nr:hypothetical protein FOZ60_005499 [Perkinsus olseni]